VIARNGGHRGAAVLTDVLARMRIAEAFTRNDMEEEFLAICERAGLPMPRVNAWIVLEDGEVQADFLWLAHRLIAETDGGETHGTRTAFYEDRRRDQRLVRAGYRVVRFTWWQVFYAPEEIMDTLRPVLRA
jgi:hypothetical protein